MQHPSYPNYPFSSCGRLFSRARSRLLPVSRTDYVSVHSPGAKTNDFVHLTRWMCEAFLEPVPFPQPAVRRIRPDEPLSAANVEFDVCKDEPGETWRRCERVPTHEVSDAGRCRTLAFGACVGSVLHNGYGVLQYGTRGNRGMVAIHLLVAEAFIPVAAGHLQCDLVVNHKSGTYITCLHPSTTLQCAGDRTDNRVINLEWTTQAENAQHAVRTGLIMAHRLQMCDLHGKPVLDDEGAPTSFNNAIIAAEAVRGASANGICAAARSGRPHAGFLWKRTQRPREPLRGLDGEVFCAIPHDADVPTEMHGASVSQFGQVKSAGGRLLRPSITVAGYARVTLKGVPMFVHRLVCRTFHGPAPDGQPCAMHVNHDKLNNRPENLRWASAVERSQNGIGKAVICVKDQVVIRYPTFALAAPAMGCHSTTVSSRVARGYTDAQGARWTLADVDPEVDAVPDGPDPPADATGPSRCVIPVETVRFRPSRTSPRIVVDAPSEEPQDDVSSPEPSELRLRPRRLRPARDLGIPGREAPGSRKRMRSCGVDRILGTDRPRPRVSLACPDNSITPEPDSGDAAVVVQCVPSRKRAKTLS